MSDNTAIEWTDATWNPVVGCDKVSPGCDNCYAIRTAHRMTANPNPKVSAAYAGTEAGGEWTGQVNLLEDRLDQPLQWKRPRRIFVNAQSDLFHKSVPDEFIARVFAVMAIAPQHTFQVLTKRPARMRALINSSGFFDKIHAVGGEYLARVKGAAAGWHLLWPLPNVWLGVSVEDQKRADLRIPALLDTPAAVRFLSCEPLLERVDLNRSLALGYSCENEAGVRLHQRPVDWVIVGGESGPNARPMHPEWARSLRDQCVAAGVPFHFKQRGEWTWSEHGDFQIPRQPFTDRVAVIHPAGMTAMTKSNPFNPFERGHPDWTTRIERVGKRAAGRLLDGRTWDQEPR